MSYPKLGPFAVSVIFWKSSPSNTHSSIQARNGVVSTPACPIPPRAKRSVAKCWPGVVTAACANHTCGDRQPRASPGLSPVLKRVHCNPYAVPSEPFKFAVKYHHSILYSGCAPWSLGKLRVEFSSGIANPSALEPRSENPWPWSQGQKTLVPQR